MVNSMKGHTEHSAEREEGSLPNAEVAGQSEKYEQECCRVNWGLGSQRGEEVNNVISSFIVSSYLPSSIFRRKGDGSARKRSQRRSGIDKEKKLGAKHNLKEKKQVKIHGVLRIGYRYPVTWYRYPMVQSHLDHVQARPRHNPSPNHAMTAPPPRLGVGFHHPPHLGVAKKHKTALGPRYSVSPAC
ncbi:hypothetical protein PIB30_034141 [Stylosanthes scabra]|uniref:Uncharacterized protein n=1 Tax=Stylosanthes scabra TaxID=79078 RepID=A0ABU6UFE3_9FABA|nr:hypothetical protein [Stylosanthes scabra]